MATKREYLPSKEDFEKYEKVHRTGQYSIFDPKAREATGLDKDTYYSIILHHPELSELYPEVLADEEEPDPQNCAGMLLKRVAEGKVDKDKVIKALLEFIPALDLKECCDVYKLLED